MLKKIHARYFMNVHDNLFVILYFFSNGYSCGIIDFLVSFPATRLEPGESTRVVSRASPIVDSNEHVVGCLSERFVVQTGQTYGDDCNRECIV